MIIEEGLITEVIDIAAATTGSEATVRRAGQCAQRSRCKGLRSKIARRSHCVARARRAQHRASAGAAKVQARRVKQRRAGEPGGRTKAAENRRICEGSQRAGR